MAVIHISEAEATRNFGAALAHVRAGEEVIIEADAVPVAVLRPPAEPPRGRKLSESIALAEARAEERGYDAVMDADFKADLAEIILNRKPSDTLQWE